MGKILVITSGKGGVGKTTAVANIGVALARMGRRVVVVDADIGLRNLDMVLGLENRIVFDIVDVVEGRVPPEKALVKDKRGYPLWLLPAAQTRDKTAVSPEQMKEVAEHLAQKFDYVLIDSPAGIEHGFRTAVTPAQTSLIITTPDVSAVRDADRVIGLLESMEKDQIHLVVNRIRADMVQRGEMLGVEDIVDILKIPLIGVVPEDERMVDYTNRGEPVVLVQNSPAGRGFQNVARRLEGEKVPFDELERSRRGFLSRIFGGR